MRITLAMPAPRPPATLPTAPKLNTPPLSAISPVKVLVPARTMVPGPALTRDVTPPPIGALTVKVPVP